MNWFRLRRKLTFPRRATGLGGMQLPAWITLFLGVVLYSAAPRLVQGISSSKQFHVGSIQRFAAQYQYFHTQSTLSGIEMALGLGADCAFYAGGQRNRLAFELTALTNQATEANRLGRDRDGWRMNLIWRRAIGAGEILGQYVLTQLNDDAGYSPILIREQTRKESFNSVFFSTCALC